MEPDINPPSDHFPLYLQAAANLGLPVAGYDPGALASRRLRAHVSAVQACRHIGDLSAWTADEDDKIRSEAIDALRRCLYLASITEHNEQVNRTSPPKPAAFLARWLRRSSATRDASWWQSWEKMRTVRRLAALCSATMAVGSAVAFVAGNTLLGLLLMLLMSGISFLDRWLAQATQHESSYWPWLACVLGHVSDALVLTGIGIHLEITHQAMAGPVFVGASATLFASLVRVSALQAGLRFFWNPKERLVRWLGALTFGIGTMSGHASLGATILVAALGVAALTETVLVLVRTAETSKTSHWPRLLVLQRENGRAFTRDPQDYGISIESEDAHHLLTQRV